MILVAAFGAGEAAMHHLAAVLIATRGSRPRSHATHSVTVIPAVN